MRGRLSGRPSLQERAMDDDTGVGGSGSSSSSSSSSGGSPVPNVRKAASAAGKSLSASGAAMSEGAGRNITPVAYRRGGKVRKTGPAVVHKNERVIPADKRKKVEKMMK